jgi:hypothetical protein
VASANPIPAWEPIEGDELAEWRRDLPKDAIRETNTAHTVGIDPVESDGDTVTFDDTSPSPMKLTELASPREVADDVFGMMWAWAKNSRENFALMAQMIRHNEPAAYGHLSDDELATKLEDHAKSASRRATEKEFKDNKWDRGNDLDMWQGKPVIP